MRWLRDLPERVREAAAGDPRFDGLRFAFPEGLFLWTPMPALAKKALLPLLEHEERTVQEAVLITLKPHREPSAPHVR